MSRKILLVDDDPSIIWTVGRYLTKCGFDVVTCVDGLEAISLLKNRDFDALVTDFMMPALDGLALVEWVNQHLPTMQILLITGCGSLSVMRMSVEQDFLYMEKPVDPASIAALLEDGVPQSLLQSSSEGAGDQPLDQPPAQEQRLGVFREAERSGDSGEVVVRSRENVGRVFFVGGQISYAYASRCGRFEEYLVHSGNTEEEEMTAILNECKRSGGYVLDMLMDWELITQHELNAVFGDWIVQCFREIFQWESPQQIFIPHAHSYQSRLSFSLDEILVELKSQKESP